jgi:hypothetical protein
MEAMSEPQATTTDDAAIVTREKLGLEVKVII